MSPVWKSSCRTDTGKVRSLNEDAYFEADAAGLWLVADGMGGHESGDVASRMIAEAMEGVTAARSVAQLGYDVRIRLYEANRKIHQLGQRLGTDTMGSTAVVFLALDCKCRFLWAGDSRAYLMRDGTLTQLTRDHSVVEELVHSGRIRPEEAADHTYANVITRAVGAEEQLELDEGKLMAQPNDRILLCSDGLNKELSDPEIAAVLGEGSCDEVSAVLIERTLARRARDNVTVAVLEYADFENSARRSRSEPVIGAIPRRTAVGSGAKNRGRTQDVSLH